MFDQTTSKYPKSHTNFCIKLPSHYSFFGQGRPFTQMSQEHGFSIGKIGRVDNKRLIAISDQLKNVHHITWLFIKKVIMDLLVHISI